MKRRIVLLGPPGSGKGTVAQKLEERFDLEHISTGQWFRREMQSGTELGEQARQYIERGELVPDEIVLGLIDHWVTPELIKHGYLFDGFPRTRAQAEALDRFCAEKSAPLEAVLYLHCSEEVVMERITGRRVCLSCGKIYHVRTLPPVSAGICDVCESRLTQRTDDTEEVVKNRLVFYQKVTEPLVDYYRESGKLVSLNADLGSEDAYVRAAQVLES
ncbi:MAG: adenylate kinase [Limisphaerales bacterium]